MNLRLVDFNLIILCLSILASSQDAYGFDHSASTPFFISNTLPISQGLGLPNTLSSKSLISGENRFDINIGMKSNANDAGSETGEQLILDGETQSLEIGWRYGLSISWQFDVQLAYVSHDEGDFDSLIHNWHDFFQLDDGDRPIFDNDEFLYSYSDGSSSQQLSDSVSGLSDIRLGLAYEIDQASLDNLLFRVGLTLPTGDSNKLTGSKEVDADFGIYMGNEGFWKWQQLAWHANLGYIFIGDDSAFGIPTQAGTWFSSLGAYFNVSPALTFKTQLDAHGAMFKSDIDELNKPAMQLTMGMSYKAQNNAIATIYFSEDITVNRGADFSLGVQFEFGL